MFGIRISVGISWFIVLFLYIIVLEQYVHELLEGSHGTAYVVTVVSALTFFLSLVLHELGHALTARRNGLEVMGIELWALGGITRTSGTTRSPGAQFAIAAAGPFATLLVIVACCVAGALAAPHQQFFQLSVERGVHTTPVGVWLKCLALLNIVVLILNLIPAFPLDGGQIVQAVVWKATGDRNRATRATGRLGQALAIAIGLASLYMLSKGREEGAWLLLISMFVYQGAGAAVVQGAIGQRLQQLTVADVMDREPVTVPAETTLLEAQEHYFARYQWPWFAVVDPSRHFLGLITRQRMETELAAGRPALTAGEALEEDLRVRIAESQPLESLLRSEALARIGGMVAVDGEGTLQGVVTLAQVREALRPAS